MMVIVYVFFFNDTATTEIYTLSLHAALPIFFLAKRHGAHGEDTWASAGGHLENGETLEECARREAMEELGVTVGALRFLCLSNIIAYGKHYVDIEFLGDISGEIGRAPRRERV